MTTISAPHSNSQSETKQRPAETTQPRGSEGVYAPRVDIVETDEAFLMYADMPGVKADNVSLHCKDGQLILHGHCVPRTLGHKPLHREYGVGDFYRSFALSDLVDTTRIEARIENGVLALTLPKAERAKPKRISVKGV